MAKISDTQLRKNARKPITDKILEYAKENFHPDAARIKDDEIMFPILDEQRNERYAVIKITIPIGENYGKTAFDGYEAAKNYEIEKEETRKRKALQEREKAEKILRDEIKREEKRGK